MAYIKWTKLQSVRSNRWTLIAAVLVTLGVTVVVAKSLVAAPATRAAPVDTLAASFLGYAEYTAAPVTVLSVLVFTSEYASGPIRTTFTAVPRRGSLLAAKAVVTGAVALVIIAWPVIALLAAATVLIRRDVQARLEP
jgi:hypothetical protein